MLLFLDFIGDAPLSFFLLLTDFLETLDFTELIECLLAECLMQGILSRLFLAEFRGRFLAVNLPPFYEESPVLLLRSRFFEAPDFYD